MAVKNLTIRTRLTISTLVFLLPLSLLFFQVISGSLASIGKDRNDLQGIECLRPGAALMALAPRYVRRFLDQDGGETERLGEELRALTGTFAAAYEGRFGSHPLLRDLENQGELLLRGSPEAVLDAFGRFMAYLRALMVHTGEISGLNAALDLESGSLAEAACRELPLALERIAALENLVSAGLPQEEAGALLWGEGLLLDRGDRVRLNAAFDRAGEARRRTGETGDAFGELLAAYNGALDRLTEALEELSWGGSGAGGSFREAADQAGDAAWKLQNAALDRLETLVSIRMGAYRRQLIQSLALALGTALAAFGIIIATARDIRKSTAAASGVFRSLENNDLSVQVAAGTGDEMGELLAALGDFIEKLKGAFISFNQNASMVSTAVYDLSASAKEITTTANEQSASVAEIVSTMESSKNLSEQVAAKTVEVADLAARTEELSRRGADLRDANQDMMQDIRDQNGKIIDEIKNLADMLSRIDESVQLIDVIADQTKLIAFNAALEASSSGEAGTRFAVVASEIRRFADNVVESVAEIKDKITELQDASQALITEANSGSRAIDAGYVRMVEQKEVFENIVDISQNVATRSQQISSLSRQQELASAQIFTALKEISAGVKQFVTATASTSATADNLNSMSIELKETLARYQTSK
jgi:methyl-accepting chemotaxis protein